MGPTKVAITVDDLPDSGQQMGDQSTEHIVRSMLKALKDNGVPQAYGFVNGYRIESNPSSFGVLKQWVDAGYPLGNHTYGHIDLGKVPAQAFITDIEKLDHLLAMPPLSQPVERRRVFRYPYLSEGDTLEKRDVVREYLARNGYRIAQVTIDYYDWAWNDAYARCVARKDEQSIGWLKDHFVDCAERRLSRSRYLADYVFGRNIPHILLIHMGSFEALMLNATLSDFRSRDVEFVSLDEALSDPVYQFNPNLASPSGRSFLTQAAQARKMVATGFFQDGKCTDETINRICDGGLDPMAAPTASAGDRPDSRLRLDH